MRPASWGNFRGTLRELGSEFLKKGKSSIITKETNIASDINKPLEVSDFLGPVVV